MVNILFVLTAARFPKLDLCEQLICKLDVKIHDYVNKVGHKYKRKDWFRIIALELAPC